MHNGNRLLSVCALAALSAAAFARPAAADDWYVKASVGQSEAEVSGIAFEPGLSYGAALGTSVGPVRVEAGVDRLSGELSLGGPSVQADALVYSVTGYLDLPVGDNASIYAGAGLDYVDGDASLFGSSIDANGDGWHWALGGAYRVSERIIGEVQYTSLSADLDAAYIGAVDLRDDRITAGLRFAL